MAIPLNSATAIPSNETGSPRRANEEPPRNDNFFEHDFNGKVFDQPRAGLLVSPVALLVASRHTFKLSACGFDLGPPLLTD